MSPHGFNIISRRAWGARSPRSRVTRAASTVDTLYIHWPAHPGNLRSERLVDWRVPENEAQDCLVPGHLLETLADLNEAIIRPQGRVDTRAEEAEFMRRIQEFHMDSRGWSDFAYNYAMFLSGRVYAGRTFKVVPASQAPHNTRGVSLCVMMGTADRVSPAVEEQLKDFTRWAERYARHDLAVKGHRQVNPTTCPGDPLMRRVPALDRL